MSVHKEYKYISLEYLDDMAGGENDFLIEMIDTYLTSIPDSLAKLKIAVESGDGNNIIHYAHKLKGSFNFIGCIQAGAILNEIEDYILQTNNNSHLHSLIEKIFEESTKITAELECLRIEKMT